MKYFSTNLRDIHFVLFIYYKKKDIKLLVFYLDCFNLKQYNLH